MRIIALAVLCVITANGAETPGPRKLPKAFWAMAAASVALEVADEVQTASCLKTVANCRETNALYGPHPSGARLFGLGAAVDFGCIVAGYEIYRRAPAPLRRFWWVSTGAPVWFHAGGIISSHHGGVAGGPSAPGKSDATSVGD